MYDAFVAWAEANAVRPGKKNRSARRWRKKVSIAIAPRPRAVI
jgi:hypothetical protein